jgi:DNA-binding winged helix-turn-helix (wHTH) protein
MKQRLDDFLLDTDLAELRRQSIEVPLQPKAYSLLCLLIEVRNRALCKDEIIDIIWKGRIITDTALSTLVKTLRHSIGDSGAQRGW